MNKRFSILIAVLTIIISTLACASSAPAGVSNIHMANKADGSNPTTAFAPTDTVYVIFDVNQVDSGAKLEIKWYALNLSGQDPATPFATTDYTYNGESTIVAHVESTQGGFPVAQYKVEIDLNGSKVGEQQFNVQ